MRSITKEFPGVRALDGPLMSLFAARVSGEILIEGERAESEEKYYKISVFSP